MREKNAHDAFTVLLRGAVNNRPRLSANNRVIRGGYQSTLVISDNPVDNRVIGGNVQLRASGVFLSGAAFLNCCVDRRSWSVLLET
jgi:hypothetical protein